MITRHLLLIVYILFSSLQLFAQPEMKRELRGAWVATVANIDWPKNRNASSGDQIKELIEIFDKLKDAGINSIFFQIRTECDALYNSPYEPWSYWLTGAQGTEPNPYYDPLEFAVAEAHKRGMELHAWFNPYRAEKKVGDYPLSPQHVVTRRPGWILDFPGYKMLDPGNPAVREYIREIVADVVTRYDVDGIHFDDYFYPYSPKVSNEDSLSFARYHNNIKNVDDWRRYSINTLMAELNEIIKAVKPRVKFGISPFGIVLNEYAGTSGFNSYDILYCDPLNWIKNRTVDYVLPQLYWEIGHEKADYAKLLPWWSEVTRDVHLYIGEYSGRFANANFKGSKSELGDHLRMTRSFNNVEGSVYFSSSSITRNAQGIADSMKNDWFAEPAFPPLMPWKDVIPPNAPKNLKSEKTERGLLLTWEAPDPPADGEQPFGYIIYRKLKNSDADYSIARIVTGNIRRYMDQSAENNPDLYDYKVLAFDRLYNISR